MYRVSKRCKRESAPAFGRTGALLVLRVAESELAREPCTPCAGRQEASTRARRLHELRSQLRLASFAEQIGVTLAVIPQMRFRVHALPSFHLQDAERTHRLPETPDARRPLPSQLLTAAADAGDGK